MSEEATDRDLLDQTLYLASKIYDIDDYPIPLDLCSACAIGGYKCVQERIDEGIDINARNKAGWTPLMYASYVGHDTIVNLLLDSGVEASRGTPTGLTPLMVAAGCGNESVCYFLIQAGAEIDAQDSNGYTALVHAVRQGHQTVVQLLLESGTNMELSDFENGYTALMFAAIEGDEIIVDVLVACGADISSKDKHGHDARFLAFSRHNVRTVTLLDNAMYSYRPMSETPTNDNIIIEEFCDGEDGRVSIEEDSSDLFSGAKEMEAYQQSLAVKMNIAYNLGRRSGPRWSLPHQYIAQRRCSNSDSRLLGMGKFPLKPSMSMPERPNPPLAVQSPEPPEAVTPEPEPDAKIVGLLNDLKLEKYVGIFQEHEIDYETLMDFTDEDLKRIGIRLMGPRRKLTLAISELKEQEQERKNQRSKGDGSKKKNGCNDDRSCTRRAQLMKQSSTDVTEAYRQALDTINLLEDQVAQEHHLRKAADSFLLKLQASRQEAVSSVVAITNGQQDLTKHCKSIKVTHGRLSDELDGLRVLSGSSIEPNQLHFLCVELITLKSKMGMELEALSRSIDSMAELTNTLSFQLKSNS